MKAAFEGLFMPKATPPKRRKKVGSRRQTSA
jgi:hypothetical protein